MIVARAAAMGADGLAYLGWKSSMRSTSVRQLEEGVAGDGGPWRAAFGIEPQSLDAMLAAHPAGVQERWFARAWFAKPLGLFTLSAFWIYSGLCGAFSLAAAASVLTQAGWSSGAANAAVLAGAVIDVLIGAALTFRSTARLALLGAIATAFGYLVLGTLVRPDLWLDPLGAYAKIIPATALAATLLALMDDR